MKNIKENENLSILNHSCAHLLAHAIKNIYPHAKFWVGPVIEEGFYYDIDLGDDVIKEEDIDKLEKEMKKISKDGKRIIRRDLTKEEALKEFKGDEYKEDLINNMTDENITCYNQGDFTDLCRGPHVETVKELKHFKLLKVSGAYWKADANNKMLQRVYGICFENEEELQEHVYLLEEAKKRDHRKLGKELDIFMISEYGPGFPFWLPNGMTIKNKLEEFWYQEHTKEGYTFINTPIMLSKELWEISGHWFNYKENMYTLEIDDKEFAIKPMSCPGAMLVYKNALHSYKDFPLRIGELGLVHRHEASGALSGLFRVRRFVQDDAHIFCTENQIGSEIIKFINFIDRMYNVFGLEYRVELSTRPEKKYIGEVKTWDKAEKLLEEALIDLKKDYSINPGDGAFYGPKLDFMVRDALGREWQCGTLQLDMNMPERFDLTYVDSDGSKKRPIMFHHVIYGSIERFIGVAIEHFAGAFPLWLSPTQINIVPVNNEYHLEYSHDILERLLKEGFRVTMDDSDEKLSYRMRTSQTMKIPYTLILGDRERDNKEISYRLFGSTETSTIGIDEFIDLIKEVIDNKKQL